MAVGVGVAASTAGVMLVEYFALTRLLHVLSRRLGPPDHLVPRGRSSSARRRSRLIDPERFYDDLLKPSLVALWLSQLIVFVVYPRFAARHGRLRIERRRHRRRRHAFALYGIWATLQHAGS